MANIGIARTSLTTEDVVGTKVRDAFVLAGWTYVMVSTSATNYRFIVTAGVQTSDGMDIQYEICFISNTIQVYMIKEDGTSSNEAYAKSFSTSSQIQYLRGIVTPNTFQFFLEGESSSVPYTHILVGGDFVIWDKTLGLNGYQRLGLLAKQYNAAMPRYHQNGGIGNDGIEVGMHDFTQYPSSDRIITYPKVDGLNQLQTKHLDIRRRNQYGPIVGKVNPEILQLCSVQDGEIWKTKIIQNEGINKLIVNYSGYAYITDYDLS